MRRGEVMKAIRAYEQRAQSWIVSISCVSFTSFTSYTSLTSFNS